MRRFAVIALAWGIVLGSTLGVCELVLRALGVEYPSLYVADATRGTALRPGAEGRWRREGDAHVRINAHGMRDRERSLTKPARGFRVALLGDSFVEALHVELPQSVGARIEEALGACPPLGGRTIEVLNFGVSGYGPAQELLTLREQALRFAPDAVVLELFPSNDVVNVSRELEPDVVRPFFVLQDDAWLRDDGFRETPEYRLRTSLAWRAVAALVARSRVAQLLNETKNAWRARAAASALRTRHATTPGGSEPGIEEGAFVPPRDARWQRAWDVAERLVTEIAHSARAADARFLLVVATTGPQVDPDPARRRAFAAALGVPDLLYAEQRLGALAAREGFPLVALAPLLADEAERTGRPLHGFPNTAPGQGHWNAEGHRAAGEAIARALCAQLP